MSTPISVLLVDDHPLVRNALRSMLEATGDFVVVGEASDGRVALERAIAVRPDVIVMDLGLPELSGLDATRRIVEQVECAAVVVLTALEDDDAVFEAVRALARGYVVKSSAPGSLLDSDPSRRSGRLGLRRGGGGPNRRALAPARARRPPRARGSHRS